MRYAGGKGDEFQRREAGTIASPAQRHPSRAELVAMYAQSPDEALACNGGYVGRLQGG